MLIDRKELTMQIKTKEVLSNSTILVIPDLHAPFQHPQALNFLSEVQRKYKPGHIICIGDEIDSHALSHWDHDPDGYSAGHEFQEAVKFLHQLYKIFPSVKCCTSNHTARYFKRAFKAGIPAAFLRSYSEVLEAPKDWQWADNWEINGILFEHGEGFSGQNAALNAMKGNMQSTVIGHVHSYAGVQYYNTPKQTLFGMNVGCLLNNEAYSFKYGRHFKVKPALGCGIIEKGVPHFIPLGD